MSFDFDSVSAPFRMQPGLRRLAPDARQLTPNRFGDHALQEKLRVLGTHPEQALLAIDSFDSTPALRALAAHAAQEHPGAFSWDGGMRWHAHHLGWSLHGDTPVGDGPDEIGACLRALPDRWRPTALIALAFAEDFAVIDGTSGHIPWLAVCLPSHWAPEDKIGRHFAQVHAPVADNRTLIAASDHLARLVTGADRWERFVWTITPREGLDQHPRRCVPAAWALDADPSTLASRAFFRTERQTFIPLPDRAQAIFTIHVDVRPLAVAVESPDHARRLHDALASMSPAVLEYRGLGVARDHLLAWLADHLEA
jgi:dimethylamine monooxygenase subunit A